MKTDKLNHELARALCKMPVMTKQQEAIKFTALELYFNHYEPKRSRGTKEKSTQDCSIDSQWLNSSQSTETH